MTVPKIGQRWHIINGAHINIIVEVVYLGNYYAGYKVKQSFCSQIYNFNAEYEWTRPDRCVEFENIKWKYLPGQDAICEN